MNCVFTYPEDKEIIKEKEYCFAKITCFSTKLSGSDFTTQEKFIVLQYLDFKCTLLPPFGLWLGSSYTSVTLVNITPL